MALPQISRQILLSKSEWEKCKCKEPVAIYDMKSMQAELNRLKAELRRTTGECDILKKAAAYFAKQS